ncbi:MAG TPA: hypothetical protein VMZ33_07030 [Candidatus Limnocylindrales bacterium]|nr:hypothetical protein [Candidatus Limnocylindrales bacterium]
MKILAKTPMAMLLIVGAVASCSTGSRPTPSPTPLPPDPTPTPTAPRANPQPQPPHGLVAVADMRVEGWAGSYCWQGTCADSPGIPPIDDLPEIESGDYPLTFTLSDGATFTSWSASYGLDGRSLQPLDEGGLQVDPDANPGAEVPQLTRAEIANPPAGDWVVSVFVRVDNGDLSYAWHVSVP